ncbi:MAG: hypothetical protein DCC49_08470 [Acidobacteria bacterium]|nr:MAG: hypothetical protein DCC49_08470 [Acidobacteriota bacterium]
MTSSEPDAPAGSAVPPGWPQPVRGYQRVRHLYGLFKRERDEPEPFYRYLASETLQWLNREGIEIAGNDLLDIGSGPGYYSAAFSAAGATVYELEFDHEELSERARQSTRTELLTIGDAGRLPFADESFDAVFSSNMLEHVPAGPAQVIQEAERVMRPGGWFYLSWTNWYSPWGGHAISPYHYLGPKLGVNVYRRIHGEPPKNVPGRSLFPVHIGQVVRIVQRRTHLVMRAMVPRYYPNVSVICRIPGLRELLAWNCLILLEKPDRPA